MSVFVWLVAVWGAGLVGVVAAGFGIALVNADIMTRIQGTPLEARLREHRSPQGFQTWDVLGYRAPNLCMSGGERPLPAGVAKDLRMLRRLELVMLSGGMSCAGVLAGCWMIGAP